MSELRKWFCHNNDSSLYYADNRQKKIKNYLNSALLFWRQIVSLYGLFTDSDRAQVKEKKNLIELLSRYKILTFNIDSRFQAYLEILEKGLLAWKDSEYKSDLLDEWITILAKSLFFPAIRICFFRRKTLKQINPRINIMSQATYLLNFFTLHRYRSFSRFL